MFATPVHPSRGHPRLACLAVVLAVLALTCWGAFGEEGEPTEKSTPPALRISLFEAAPPSPLLFDFNDLIPGVPVACDHYADRGLHLFTGPESCRPGVITASGYVPHLFCSGPCDGSPALRTDPFAGPSLKFVIPDGAMSAEIEIGDYGPSDADNIQFCAYEDAAATRLLGCTFASLAQDHDTCCEPLRLEFDGAIFRSLAVISDSAGCMPNSVFADNLFIDGMCEIVTAPELFQDDPRWSGLPMSGTSGALGNFGAGVTTYAMLLNKAGATQGFETDPASLELWLAGEADGLLAGHVNPFAIARLAAREGLDLSYHGVRKSSDVTDLMVKTCAEGLPAPMLLHTTGGSAGDHMVLGLRQVEFEERVSWQLNDPSGRACHTGCSCYPMSFTEYYDFRRELSRRAMLIALEGEAELLVVDPEGRRSGYDEQLAVELAEIPDMALSALALSDAQDILAGEFNPLKTAERFEPMPGRYCIKPTASDEEGLVARFMFYDEDGQGVHQAIPFIDDPARRPTLILNVPTGLNPVPLVQLFDNRAPYSAPSPLGERECTSPAGAPFDLVVADWNDLDCDHVTHTWTGPFPQGGGVLTGESVSVTLPLGRSSVSLVTDDGLLDSPRSYTEALVVDTTNPEGRITAPENGSCHPGPVTVMDDFADVCDASLARTYFPGPGPTYTREGPHLVTLTVRDDVGNSASDQVAFVIDTQAPLCSARAPQMEQDSPTTMPISFFVRTSDRDLNPGNVVRERILLDGCPILDGKTYGDGDGLLKDELFEVTSPLFCLAHQTCGQTLFADSVFTVEAEDCAGNLSSDKDVIAGTYTIDELNCQ